MVEPSETIQTHGRNSYASSTNWKQFWCMLWKNWLLQKKMIGWTLLVVLFPIFWSMILALIQKGNGRIFMKDGKIYDSFSVTPNLLHDLRDPPEKLVLAYVPKTTLVARIVNRSAALMGITITPDLGFASEDELEKYVRTNEDIFGAIVFGKSEWEILPKNISYKIRLRSYKRTSGSDKSERIEWKTNVMTDAADRRKPGPRDDIGPVYRDEGFLAIQKAVDLSLIAEANPNFDPTKTNVGTQLKQYPFPPYLAAALTDIARHILPWFTPVSYIVTALTICQEIVLEKENKFKEFTKLMGMPTGLYWSSWLIKYMSFMLISKIVMTVFCHAPLSSSGPVIVHTTPTVTFVFLFLYSLSLVTFCFFMSTLFSKVNYGMILGVLLFVMSFVLYLHLEKVYGHMSLVEKFLASVDFNLALGLGFVEISQHEAIDTGIHWSNIWSSGEGYTMGHIMIMLSVDIIFYSMLTWYLDAVIPGDFGIPQPFYFPFLKDYWMGKAVDKITMTNDAAFVTLVPENKRPYFETPAQDAKTGIQIRGLTKNFGCEANPVVNNLNIDIYEGNITALVGDKGAGKTTTLLMLAGFLPPSKGTAYINGFDITGEIDKIRPILGFCQQHDIRFDALTVKENLLFFAILKGSSCDEAEVEVNEMIKVLQMTEDINAKAKTLSSGEKRKLSVGIALISSSKFVLLDEPTSGLDPKSRRQIWDILQSQRKDRTMILSTNCIYEAEIMCDRIAIVSNGEIQCYGSPMFLKNNYGFGYHLTILKTSTCDVDHLLDVITSQIPMSHMVSNEAEEVTFALPSNQVSEFERLFEKLETDGKTLGIDSLGVYFTSMEEIFLRVKNSSTLEDGSGIRLAEDADIQENTSQDRIHYQKETGLKHQNLQLIAMFYKRLIYARRNNLLLFSQILITLLSIILAGVTPVNRPRYDDSNTTSLTLDLTLFSNPITPHGVQNRTVNALKLSTCYKSSVSRHRESDAVLISSEPEYTTMDNYLLAIGKINKEQYNRDYKVGATVEEGSGGTQIITGFFNNQFYHTIAISLSYLGNTMMQCFGSKEYQIETINHPLQRNYFEEVLDNIRKEKKNELGFSSCLSIGLAILFATFLVFLIKERQSGAKLSQLLSGVKKHNFWLTTFIWDYVNYLVLCIVIEVIILCFHREGYWQHSWIIFIGLMLYGFSMLPFTYIMSFIFDKASVGFLWVSFIGFVTGALANIVGVALQKIASQSDWQTVEWIFYIFFPSYCFIAVLQNICDNHNRRKDCTLIPYDVSLAELCASKKRLSQANPCCPGSCGDQCIEMVDDYLSFTLPGVGRPFFFMVLQGIVFFLILYIIETNSGGRLLQLLIPKRVSQSRLKEMHHIMRYGKIGEDSDIVHERQRIQSHPIQELVKTDTVVTQDLTKLYGKLVAVNQLSIGVSPRECLGLLGVSGAGKTTTFKMLTGEIRPSFGSAYIAGISVQDDLAPRRTKIGYCQQLDSIIEQMTVHETLWMYACAHGIPGKVREEVIDRLIDDLTLKPYTKQQAGNLSGGNKRKLCLAVALMGNPTVVFLDEPTTGVDPEARRHVWNTLADARRAGTAIILASHSMTDCEAICTRMGILVNGHLLCLGSLQHLRNKFSHGYTITVKLQSSSDTETSEELQERTNKMQTFISDTFPESVIKDHHHEDLICYQVKTRVLKWSEIFGIMERAKETYQIDYYTVGQITLEQIFVEFAGLQQGPTESSKKKFFELPCRSKKHTSSNSILPGCDLY